MIRFALPTLASMVLAILAQGCASTPAAQSPPASAADQERAACAEISDADRDGGPFARRDRVVRVEPLLQTVSPKAPAPPAGVAVYLRATPGMTEQWVGRLVQCHVAHRAALGSTDGGNDPLAIEDARVAVSSTPTELRVAITSSNVERARRILRAGSTLATN
jgi:hypothetical protein